MNSAIVLMILLLLSSHFSGGPSASQDSIEPSLPVYDFKIETGWINVRDGTRLAATFYKPVAKTSGETFPVLFEFLPYRKDDGGQMGTYSLYTYFVRRGYILVRVDIRGTGSSEGVFPLREYSEQELDDAEDIIAKLAAMPGANGRVGMWGISWGGFNAIQVAMRRPPALRAILAAMATDDLYHDDIHYIDGVFHVDEWAFWFDHSKAIPQSPHYLLDEGYFRDRFESYPGLLTYLKQQRDGDFWRKNSLRRQYDKIQVPCYLIGGLLDGYRDSIPRMLENMIVPIKAELGPYNHSWPDDGVPGPNYEWRREAVRWWDHWLKDRDTGVLEDPRLALFLRDSHPPDPGLDMTPGTWIHTEWPIPGTGWKKFYPAEDHRLLAAPGKSGEVSLAYVPGYGINSGLWWGEPTGDMRPDDAGSLVFDSPVLEKDFVIAGLPRVRLRVAADVPLAHWAVRLEDVLPDGRVSLVAGGLINGAQRQSRLHPEYLEPGKSYDLEFDLHFTTWTYRAGHRVRLAVTNSLFPMIWPTPYPMMTTLTIGIEETQIALPVIPPGPYEKPGFQAPEPRESVPDAQDFGSDYWPQGTYEQRRDLVRGTTTVEWRGQGSYEVKGVRYSFTELNIYETNDRDPARSRFLGEANDRIELPGRKIFLLTNGEIVSDEKNFHLTFTRRIYENDILLRTREWKETVPRDFQ
ncbi:MAG: CocE/NonD family hydrolase [Candidatus Aminicenantes bacterium]|nr:CocE/NonD family hydrolase [Candidatus Aminicenantes bacterium]